MRLDPLQTWNRLSGTAAGRWVFSVGVGLRAPYFLTVRARVREVAPGRAVVFARKRWRVRNHLGGFHAIAMCNLAEMAMGLVAEVTVPRSHRWIPTGIGAEYIARAETALTAEAVLDPVPAFGSEKFEAPVEVAIRDANDTVVARVTIPIRISARR
ncbi:MAG: DUF4442 domain-containing protein [Actinobacteria bacterium]|nr:DUF4442 domain-containing protein [Actinomycetota bacterium]